jgi:hypothetical protein
VNFTPIGSENVGRGIKNSAKCRKSVVRLIGALHQYWEKGEGTAHLEATGSTLY